MGISLESSGIKVGEDKCYLVNLNADPALNELLVYYLKVKRDLKYLIIHIMNDKCNGVCFSVFVLNLNLWN